MLRKENNTKNLQASRVQGACFFHDMNAKQIVSKERRIFHPGTHDFSVSCIHGRGMSLFKTQLFKQSNDVSVFLRSGEHVEKLEVLSVSKFYTHFIRLGKMSRNILTSCFFIPMRHTIKNNHFFLFCSIANSISQHYCFHSTLFPCFNERFH